jgi:hypothetical protein
MTTADRPTGVQLDAATAEFVTGVTSMSIATRDAQLLPAVGKALGCTVSAERIGHEAAQRLVNRCVQIHTCLSHLPFLEWCAVLRNFRFADDGGPRWKASYESARRRTRKCWLTAC